MGREDRAIKTPSHMILIEGAPAVLKVTEEQLQATFRGDGFLKACLLIVLLSERPQTL